MGKYCKQKKRGENEKLFAGVTLCYAQWIAFRVHLAPCCAKGGGKMSKIVNSCIFRLCSRWQKLGRKKTEFFYVVVHCTEIFVWVFVLFHVAIKSHPTPPPMPLVDKKSYEINGTFWAFKTERKKISCTNYNRFSCVYLWADAAVSKILFFYALFFNSWEETIRTKRQKGSVKSNKVAKYLFYIWKCVKKEKGKKHSGGR